MQSDRTEDSSEETGKEYKRKVKKKSESNGSTSQPVAASSDCEMKMNVLRLVYGNEVPHNSKGHEETLKSESKTESLNDAQSPGTSLNDSIQSSSITLYSSSSNESLNKEDVSQIALVTKNELFREQRRFSLDAARINLKEFFEFPEAKRTINSDFEIDIDMKELVSNISIPSDIAYSISPRYYTRSDVGAHESCNNSECLCKEHDDTSNNTESVRSPRHSPTYRDHATQMFESVGKRKYNEDSFKEWGNKCPNSSLSLNTEDQIVSCKNYLADLQPIPAIDEQNNNSNLELLASSILNFQQSNENLPNRDAPPCFELLWGEINFKPYASEDRSMKNSNLPDDEFFEADRYTGDKGKQPALKKYAYKKKSKSSQKQTEGESAEKSISENLQDLPGTSGINPASLPLTISGSTESNNIPSPASKKNPSDYVSDSRFNAEKRETVIRYNNHSIKPTAYQLSRQASSDSTTAEADESIPQLPLYDDAFIFDSMDESKQLQIALLLSLKDAKTASSDEESTNESLLNLNSKQEKTTNTRKGDKEIP